MVNQNSADHHDFSDADSVGASLPTGSRVVNSAAVCCLLFLAISFCFSGLPTTVAQSVPSPATPPGAKVVATNLRGFGVPFRVDADDESLIEVQLYQSSDRGKTWRFHSRRTTDQSEFPFQAQADGEYWFALKTLDRNRQLLPVGDPQPELVILVDTVQPELEFRIETDPAGRVNCRWRASDTNLDAKSLQIFYQPVESVSDENQDAWLKVPVQLQGISRNGVYADQVGWWPETTANILKIRLTIADAAGNLVQQDRFLSVPPSPWRHRDMATARTGDPQTNIGQLPNTPPVAQPRAQTAATQNTKQLHCENGICYMQTGSKPRNEQRTPQNQAVANRTTNAAPRIATSKNQFPSSSALPLVGGPPELAAPPVPVGFRTTPPRPAVRQSPSARANANRQSANSVAWSSEPERWIPQHQASVSTTYGRDPRILPNPYVQQPDRNRELPASNPSSLKTVGDQVVSESTTMRPFNQYQGPVASPATQSPSRQPELLPQQPAVNPDQFANAQTSSRRSDAALRRSPATDSSYPRTDFPGYQSVGHRSHDAVRNERGQGTGFKTSYQDNRRSVMDSQQPVEAGDSAIQSIGTRRFRLNYGIDAIDPSGVARVDLWMTRDGGQTWNSWGNDPDNTSPFPVEVQEEGRYGFRIVVHSKDGLTGRGPSSGDEPDIWVQVDTESPLAQITSVPYGRGDEAGRLVINYSVADPHLVMRPVTLAFSRNPEGPWTAIDQGLRNEGRYVWKPSSNVPDRIFLRLDARDRAGNVGVHILSQAIDVSGLVPRGTIHGVVPVGN